MLEFSAALTQDESVLMNEDATQSEVNAALAALTDVHAKLVEVEEPTDPVDEVEKSDLEAKVNAVNAENLASEDFTESSWSEFSAALSQAESVLVSDDATQDEVDVALVALTKDHTNLVEVEEPKDTSEVEDK